MSNSQYYNYKNKIKRILFHQTPTGRRGQTNTGGKGEERQGAGPTATSQESTPSKSRDAAAAAQIWHLRAEPSVHWGR
jgi:hypothetical protein